MDSPSSRLALTATSLVAKLGLVAGIGMLGLCALAGPFPLLDELNHFQPFWLLASLVTLAASWIAARGNTVRWSMALAACNAMLLLAPITRLAAVGAPVQASPVPSGEPIKVLTHNMYWYTRTPEQEVDLILAEAPDIVLLQEVSNRSADVLNRRLLATYPYRRFCDGDVNCDSALLSKRPWIEVHHFNRGPNSPPGISALFALKGGHSLRVIGLHMWNPKAPRRQGREIAWLGEQIGRSGELKIVGGDFNLTPWTFALGRFERTGGVVRRDGIVGTWAATRYLPAMFPIDHILTSPEIAATSVYRGGRTVSDHYPVVATLVLPQGLVQPARSAPSP